MDNFVQEGAVVPFTAPVGGVTKDLGYLIGSRFCVATASVAAGSEFQGLVRGVVDLVKVGSQAWTEGVKVYWDDGNSRCTSVATAGPLIGVAVSAVGSGAGETVGRVLLNDGVSDEPYGEAATLVSLTDSTGLSGTHDDTLSATSLMTTLTDSTGLDGTHDDTIAAIVSPTFAWNGATDPTAAEGTEINTALTVLSQNDSDISQKIVEIRVFVAALAQNASDTAQKVNEIIAALRDAKIIAT